MQYVHLDLAEYKGLHLEELFSGSIFPNLTEHPLFLTLAYSYYWFAIENNKIESEQLPHDLLTLALKSDEEKIFALYFRKILGQQLTIYFIKKGAIAKKSKIKIVDHFHLAAEIHLLILSVEQEDYELKKEVIFLKTAKQIEASNILLSAQETVILKLKNGANEEGILFDISLEKDSSPFNFRTFFPSLSP